MKKKVLLFFILVGSLFITGCTVDYNLDFTDSELNESININLDSSENNQSNIESMNYSAQYESNALSINGNSKKYSFNGKQTNNGYIGSFSYKYNIEDFNSARLIRECYDSFNFVKTEKGYQLVTSGIFRCGVYSYMKVDKYTITITSNHKVIESNADKVEKNKYIWVINPNGQVNINKPIKIIFSNETMIEEISNELLNNSKLITYIVVGIIGCAIMIVSIIYIIKTKKNGN